MLPLPSTLLALLTLLTLLTLSLSAPIPTPWGLEPMTGAFAGTQAANGAVSVAKGTSPSVACDVYLNRVNKGEL